MKILHKLENDITDYVISIEWSGSKSQVTRTLLSKGCILLIHFLPPQRVLSQMISLSLIVLSLLSIRELDQHRR